MKFAFIIQARLGSSRLPKKMILPFYNGWSILDIILEKIKLNFPDDLVILATSVNEENDVLEQKAKEKGCLIFRGDENNVLLRFCNAANQYSVNNIIRICADNPFLDVEELKRLKDFANENLETDYIGFNIKGVPSIKTHYGFWAEYTTLKTLEKVRELTQEPLYQEHVTNYIYENPSIFNIKYLDPHSLISNQENIRMTLDTQQDFEVLSEIYSKLYAKYKKKFGIPEILNILNENEDYKERMLSEIRQNSK